MEEFTELVYDQVHQEQIAVSEMTENIAEILVVQEQVIVGLRPERLVDAWGPQGELERAACPRSEVLLLSPVVMVQDAAHDDAATGREEDVEEDDGLVEYFSEGCVPGDAGQRVAVSGPRRCQAVAALQWSGCLPVLAG